MFLFSCLPCPCTRAVVTWNFAACESVSTKTFLVDDDILGYCCCSTSSNRQPLDGIPLVERPRGDNDDEGKSGATERNEKGELDILEDVSHYERDRLRRDSVIRSM